MIRASELAGRPVVDIDMAEKVGTIEKLILDPNGQRVAGFVIARGGGFASNKGRTTIPASAVHAIGPDAVTVKREGAATVDVARLEGLPRGSDVIGRKIVTEDGRYLGKVDDVLIEREGGRIFGYVLTDHKGKGKRPYLPAESNLKAGKDLIVASESAMRYDWKDEDASGTPGRWSDPVTVSDTPGPWIRKDAADEEDATDQSSRETNPRL